MSRTEAQRGDPEVGVCHVCGGTFPTQEEPAAWTSKRSARSSSPCRSI